MSNINTNKLDLGISQKQISYSKLKDAYTYSCQKIDNNYRGFSNGINCLCPANILLENPDDRKNIRINKNYFNEPTFGWKIY